MNQHHCNLSSKDCVSDLTLMKTPWTYSKEMLRILNCRTLTWSSVMFALLDPLTPRSLTRSSWTRHLARSTTRVRVILKPTSSDVNIIWCISCIKTAKIMPVIEQVSHIPLVDLDSCYYILDISLGIDMLFLQTAISMASTAVYSLHKTSTRDVSFHITSSFHSYISVIFMRKTYNWIAFSCSTFRRKQMIGKWKWKSLQVIFSESINAL